MTTSFALLYTAICLCVIGFQCAMVAGAPWGHLTQGGRTTGTLPRAGRIAAAVSCLIIAAMACGVLSAAELWPQWPAWTGWAALALQIASTIMNWATPSRAERRLWGPVTTVMLIAAVFVLFAG